MLQCTLRTYVGMTSPVHLIGSGAAYRMFPPVTSAREPSSAAQSMYWGVTLMGTELQQPACKSAQLSTHVWMVDDGRRKIEFRYPQANCNIKICCTVCYNPQSTQSSGKRSNVSSCCKAVGQQLALMASVHLFARAVASIDLFCVLKTDLVLLLCAGILLMLVQVGLFLVAMTANCIFGSLAVFLLLMTMFTVQWQLGSFPEKLMLLPCVESDCILLTPQNIFRSTTMHILRVLGCCCSVTSGIVPVKPRGWFHPQLVYRNTIRHLAHALMHILLLSFA